MRKEPGSVYVWQVKHIHGHLLHRYSLGFAIVSNFSAMYILTTGHYKYQDLILYLFKSKSNTDSISTKYCISLYYNRDGHQFHQYQQTNDYLLTQIIQNKERPLYFALEMQILALYRHNSMAELNRFTAIQI